MLDSEVQNALRANFTQCFKALTRDITQAAQLRRVIDDFARASESILSDLIDDWQREHDLLRRLPSELIARCFECLPFRDLVVASHVSRGWRSVALAHPAVWADIDLSAPFNDKTALLEMALARSGQLPVVIRNCPEPVRPGTVGNILAAHLSHIQHLDLPRRVYPAILNAPAPELRSLYIQTKYRIHEHFLGGRAGQLQNLRMHSVILPQTCPALSTVTVLTLHPHFDPDIGNYQNLFRLFPALQSLSVLELGPLDGTFVPQGPAPPFLRHLVLESVPPGQFDVCECYERWASAAPNVCEVTITQYTPPGQHLRHMVSGAVELKVACEFFSHGQMRSNITAVGPGERRRTLEFWSSRDAPDRLALALLDVRSSLTAVRSLDIGSASPGGLPTALLALPNLAHLTVTQELSEGRNLQENHDLASLSRIPEFCPGLQSLTIRGERHGSDSAKGVLCLFDQLESLAHAKLPDILVQGFTSDDLRGMQMPRFDGFQVLFDTAGQRR